jgi:hypothetical protein
MGFRGSRVQIPPSRLVQDQALQRLSSRGDVLHGITLALGGPPATYRMPHPATLRDDLRQLVRPPQPVIEQMTIARLGGVLRRREYRRLPDRRLRPLLRCRALCVWGRCVSQIKGGASRVQTGPSGTRMSFDVSDLGSDSRSRVHAQLRQDVLDVTPRRVNRNPEQTGHLLIGVSIRE